MAKRRLVRRIPFMGRLDTKAEIIREATEADETDHLIEELIQDILGPGEE